MDRPDFHELAEQELNEAAQYYDLEEPGLGSTFLDDVERCLQRRWPPSWRSCAPTARRTSLARSSPSTVG
jgi:hypothetical protein